jgi:threonine efflux protein
VTLPWAEFLAVWAFLAANIASPGPNVLNTIALAMGSGRMAGLGSATGVALGIGVWCLGMTYGVATAISHLPGAQAALTVVAVGLLVWFSARYLRAAHAGFHARTTGAPPAREGVDFAGGFRRSSAVAFGLHAAYSQIFSTAVALRLYLRAGWVLQGTAGIFFAGFALKLAVGVLRGAL